jgi:tRNA threonylcarbamoyladenosine modification (KEOPS) complex Cgi121 subunit
VDRLIRVAGQRQIQTTLQSMTPHA